MNRICIILLSTLFISVTHAQVNWGSGITIAPSSYGNKHPRLALDGSGNPLVVWGKSVSNQAYFSKWNGAAFTMPVMVHPAMMPVFAESWAGPDLAAYGDTIYITFKEEPEATSNAYMTHSYDGGATFSAPVIVDNIGDSVSRFIIVTTDDMGNPLAAYMKFDSLFMNPQYVVVRSADYGNSFTSDVQASGFSGGVVCDCCPATLVHDNGFTAMVYRDNLNNVRNMWAGISANGGMSFTSGMQVDQTNWFNNSCPASGPDAVIIGDSLYSVFMSEGTGDQLVYFSASSISTMQPGPAIPVTGAFPGLTAQNYPRIAHDGNAVAIVWRQTVNGADQANMIFTTDITAGLPATYDTVAMSTLVWNADVLVKDSKVHLVWEDGASGTAKYRQGTFVATSLQNSLSHSAKLFPNPSSDKIYIESQDEILSVVLRSADGRVLPARHAREGSRFILDVSSLNSGIYTAEIRTSSAYTFNKVIVH